ncbi:hypothetical protein PGQ11_002370 [Apiospora arundinis]|uniref:Uncharacterized protein n=1 Tax=Apiospora arundinis TaxID=335852 RepID=A0ABR2JIB4_9PEZI
MDRFKSPLRERMEIGIAFSNQIPPKVRLIIEFILDHMPDQAKNIGGLGEVSFEFGLSPWEFDFLITSHSILLDVFVHSRNYRPDEGTLTLWLHEPALVYRESVTRLGQSVLDHAKEAIAVASAQLALPASLANHRLAKAQPRRRRVYDDKNNVNVSYVDPDIEITLAQELSHEAIPAC